MDAELCEESLSSAVADTVTHVTINISVSTRDINSIRSQLLFFNLSLSFLIFFLGTCHVNDRMDALPTTCIFTSEAVLPGLNHLVKGRGTLGTDCDR